MTPSGRRVWPLAAFILVTSQFVYVRTLAPTVTTEDSGELIAAAVGLGVAHPPGYPLWTLLGHAASRLPWPSRAMGINYLSAALGSLGVCVLFFLGLELGMSMSTSAAVALAVAFSDTFWSQAVIAEVYTLHALLLGLVLLGLVRWRNLREPSAIVWTGLFTGLGIANHYMLTLLVAPTLVAYLLWSIERPAAITGAWRPSLGVWPWRALALATLALAASCSLYFYLPWAASHRPAMNWGDPSSWERFWSHVLRRSYRDLELGAPATLGTKLLFLGHMFRLYVEQWTPYLAVPALLLALGRVPGRLAERLLLWGIVALNGPALIGILRFSFEAENRWRVEEYYIPCWISLALLAGLGADARLRACRPSRRMLIAGVVPLVALLVNYRGNDLHQRHLARDYNLAILESLEKDAVYFPGADYNSFPCAYLQAVEDVRTDVLLADVTGQLSQEAQDYLASVTGERKQYTQEEAQRIVIEEGKRPVYFTVKSDVKVRPSPKLVPWGWVYRVDTVKLPAPSRRPRLDAARLLRGSGSPTALDELSRGLAGDACLMDAEDAMVRGDVERARGLFETAGTYAAGSKEGLNNLGSTSAERGIADLAERYFREAASLYPGYATARRNLAELLRGQGRLREAMGVYEELRLLDPSNESLARLIEELEQQARATTAPGRGVAGIQAALRLAPGDASLWNNLGSAHADRGQAQEAIAAYLKAMELDPGYAMPRLNLALVYRNLLHDEAAYGRYILEYEALGGSPR